MCNSCKRTANLGDNCAELQTEEYLANFLNLSFKPTSVIETDCCAYSKDFG